MARYTSVYGSFVNRSSEVELLVNRASLIEKSGGVFKHGKEIDALCRGAVVLLSSHIEAYIKELGENVLDSVYKKGICRSKLADEVFYHASKDYLNSIRDSSGASSISSNVFAFLNTDAHLWRKIDKLPAPIRSDEFNKGFANPKFERIKAYFGRFGYSNYQRDLYRALAADATATFAQIDQIVTTRNAIAHGEASATKTPSEVKEMIASAKRFCRATDSVFAGWCAVEICPIR